MEDTKRSQSCTDLRTESNAGKGRSSSDPEEETTERMGKLREGEESHKVMSEGWTSSTSPRAIGGDRLQATPLILSSSHVSFAGG